MAMTAAAIATALYLTMSVCIEAKLQAGAVNESLPCGSTWIHSNSIKNFSISRPSQHKEPRRGSAWHFLKNPAKVAAPETHLNAGWSGESGFSIFFSAVRVLTVVYESTPGPVVYLKI